MSIMIDVGGKEGLKLCTYGTSVYVKKSFVRGGIIIMVSYLLSYKSREQRYW